MPDHDLTSLRLFLDARLEAGAAVEATPAQTNYLLNVMRLDADDTVLVFDGASGEWRARLERPARKRLILRPETRTREQPAPPDLDYLFAPLKHARLDYMVQKAVEMGVGVLQPVATRHTQVSRVNTERMRANAIEAAEQCGVLHVPECREPVTLERLLGDFPPGRRLVFCDEREAGSSPVELLRRDAPGPLSLLIGPEGGFAAQERELLRSLPFVVPISLGPRILRADTAAVAALAVLQAAIGDWMPRERWQHKE